MRLDKFVHWQDLEVEVLPRAYQKLREMSSGSLTVDSLTEHEWTVFEAGVAGGFLQAVLMMREEQS